MSILVQIPQLVSPQHKNEYGEGTLGSETTASPLYEQAKTCHATAIKAWLEDARQLPDWQVMSEESPATQEELTAKRVYQDGEDGYVLEVTETASANDWSIGRLELRDVVLDREHALPAPDTDTYILPIQSSTQQADYTVITSAVMRMEDGTTPQEVFVAHASDSQVAFDNTATGIVRKEVPLTLQEFVIPKAVSGVDIAPEYCAAMQSLVDRLDS